MKKTITLLLTMLLSSAAFASSDTDSIVKALQHQWAVAKYQTAKDQREKAFEQLAEQAKQQQQAHPDSAEVITWHAIILSTYAGEKGGLGALGLVKEAKALLEQAEAINPKALHGSIYTSLGSLYYQVPGWPIGFGNDNKAREYLLKGLELNPDGIDANYFYGDFLLEDGQPEQAIKAFEKALNAADRPDRPIADVGRRDEVRAGIEKARKEL
jgi:tetratricopeptide (TPR) repeat protein